MAIVREVVGITAEDIKDHLNRYTGEDDPEVIAEAFAEYRFNSRIEKSVKLQKDH
ncbi:hypothetical protein [Bacillus sp. SM2101]|uniref:hypothetical protein n=1 Tax=Bacillus sp. SM2101 TaxID=2805366 RepID=UPI001BDE1453|nr:hypothetical protein [Bacillus sp. SM2101]